MAPKLPHWEDIAPYWEEYHNHHTNSTKSDIIHISKGLVPFWDDYLINRRFSDVELSVNKPVLKEVIHEFTNPLDGQDPGYFNVIKEDGFYRMYYGAYYGGVSRT